LESQTTESQTCICRINVDLPDPSVPESTYKTTNVKSSPGLFRSLVYVEIGQLFSFRLSKVL